MKYKIGDSVLAEPKCGPMAGQEFMAHITDIVSGQYIVEDQDSDFFTADEDEISLLKNHRN